MTTGCQRIKDTVVSFAQEIHIDPGIVVGRLPNERPAVMHTFITILFPKTGFDGGVGLSDVSF